MVFLIECHLDSLTLGGLVVVVVIDDNSDGNFDDDDSHDNDNHLHSQLLVSWLWWQWACDVVGLLYRHQHLLGPSAPPRTTTQCATDL